MTPLLYCANRGYTHTAKLLLELGADRAHTDRNVKHISVLPTTARPHLIEFLVRCIAATRTALLRGTLRRAGSSAAVLQARQEGLDRATVGK